jgi:hypothetical protein
MSQVRRAARASRAVDVCAGACRSVKLMGNSDVDNAFLTELVASGPRLLHLDLSGVYRVATD